MYPVVYHIRFYPDIASTGYEFLLLWQGILPGSGCEQRPATRMLKEGQAVYEATRQRNSQRWYDKARNRNPVTLVWHNPPTKN